MIGVTFKGDETIIKSDQHVYQWDTGQKIMVSGLGNSSINQVHFSFNGLKTAYPVNVTNSSGTVTVNIPNIVLRYGKDVYMYLCIKNTNGTVVTIKTVIIPVIKRNMPENYMYDDNETVAVKLDELQTEIQRSTGVDTDHETRITSLEEAKTNTSGTTFETLKERLDADFNVLSVLNNDLSIIYPIQRGDRVFVSKWEQGRYQIDSSTNVVSKNDADDIATKAIRIRSDIFYLDTSVRVEVTTGYEFEIYKLDSNNVLLKHDYWMNSIILEGGYYYAIVIKTDSSANIDCKIANNIVSVTSVNNSVVFENAIKTTLANSHILTDEVLLSGIRYTYGGYITNNYNSKIEINNTSGASHNRIRSDGVIKSVGYVRIECDEGYTVKLTLVDGNLNWKGNVIANDEGIATKYDFMIMVYKSDNSEITLSEAYEHVRVYTKKYITFTFESGGTGTTADGYYTQNNTEASLPIRIRTNPTLINVPFRLTAKEGYSFELSTYEKDQNGFKKLKQEQTYSKEIWLKETIHPAYKDKYISISVKSDSGNSIYPYRLNQYLEFEYDYANKCVGAVPKRFEEYKVLYIGDSITEVNYTAPCNWTKLINSWMNFESVNNQANGGCGIIAGGDNSWNTKIENITGDYDLILIMGNMNDYSNNVFDASKLGQFGDNTTATEYGALNVFLRKVLEKFPLAKVGWITSTPRQYYSGDPDNPNPIVSEGYLYGKNGVFEGAVKAIKDTCENYSVPVLDLYHESGFQPWKTEQKLAWMYDDGNYVHPNDDGHMIMALKIADFIKKNF